MLSDQMSYVKAKLRQPSPLIHWYVQAKLVQSLEQELCESRAYFKTTSQYKSNPQDLLLIDPAIKAKYGGLDVLVGVMGLKVGTHESTSEMLCTMYLGEGRQVRSKGKQMGGYVMPAIGLAGISAEGVLCAGYVVRGQFPRVVSWDYKNHPRHVNEVRRKLRGKCAWTLITRDTPAYESIAPLAMLLVRAARQGKL